MYFSQGESTYYISFYSGMPNHVPKSGITYSEHIKMSKKIKLKLAKGLHGFNSLIVLMKNSKFSLCPHSGIMSNLNHVIFFCENSRNLLDTQIQNLNRKLTSIKHLMGHQLVEQSDRKKRGIFDGVSYTLNWFFGIPDAEAAKFYDDSIKALLTNNRNTQLLMKQHISIISNTKTIKFYSTTQNLKLNENKLNSNIELFNKFQKIQLPL